MSEKIEDVVVEETTEKPKYATVNDFKGLAELRKSKAVDFVIPNTEMVVKILPMSEAQKHAMQVDVIKNIVQRRHGAEPDDEGKMLEKSEFIRTFTNTVIKFCVVEPQITDEMLSYLDESEIGVKDAILNECMRISNFGQDGTVSGVEDFLLALL